ncbi:MAG: Uma2 family endonuclease [Candidatus Saccharimonas sp.]|nr:Uma2 family endonuclease [Planctomycetaceae bacterium]
MAAPQRKPRLTPDEYLEFERQSEFKHEYFDGEIFAMAGGTPQHSLVKTNVVRELSTGLKGHRCTTYDSDLRVLIEATGLYTYPDASVFCDELRLESGRKDVAVNPTVLVEVLSASSEAYDRGKKFGHYRQIPSLREYVLVWQEEPRVESFYKNDQGVWTLTEAAGMDAKLPLASLGVSLSLSEVFDKVVFEPVTAPPSQASPE